MHKIISPELRMKITLEALKGQLTWAQICSKYNVSQPQIGRFKKQAEESMIAGFSKKPNKLIYELNKKNETLLKLLGEAQLENAWLKKKSRGFAD